VPSPVLLRVQLLFQIYLLNSYTLEGIQGCWTSRCKVLEPFRLAHWSPLIHVPITSLSFSLRRPVRGAGFCRFRYLSPSRVPLRSSRSTLTAFAFRLPSPSFRGHTGRRPVAHPCSYAGHTNLRVQAPIRKGPFFDPSPFSGLTRPNLTPPGPVFPTFRPGRVRSHKRRFPPMRQLFAFPFLFPFCSVFFPRDQPDGFFYIDA